METTYRIVDLADRDQVGLTAASPELAKLAAAALLRGPKTRFALEQTDWEDAWGKAKPRRSIIIEAEDPVTPWDIGN